MPQRPLPRLAVNDLDRASRFLALDQVFGPAAIIQRRVDQLRSGFRFVQRYCFRRIVAGQEYQPGSPQTYHTKRLVKYVEASPQFGDSAWLRFLRTRRRFRYQAQLRDWYYLADVRRSGGCRMDVVAAKLYTVILLFHAGELLMLRRAEWKKFAPGRWTGLGGRVESDELEDLGLSALRELFEETDLQPAEVSPLVLRRTLTFYNHEEGLVTLLYFTGETTTNRVPICTEGSLAWINRSALDRLDVIENTARVLSFVLEDVEQPEAGIRCGVARLDDRGGFVDLEFS